MYTPSPKTLFLCLTLSLDLTTTIPPASHTSPDQTLLLLSTMYDLMPLTWLSLINVKHISHSSTSLMRTYFHYSSQATHGTPPTLQLCT